MKPEFNYESVPFDFSHCFCGQCKVADKCLRHQVALRIPESRYSVPVINPNNVSPDGENCRYFKADRMAVYGLGISRMFDDLNYRKAIAVRRQDIIISGEACFTGFFIKNAMSRPPNRSISGRYSSITESIPNRFMMNIRKSIVGKS